MPHMSVVPFATTVVYAGAEGATSFHFSPEDGTAVIQGIPPSGNLDVFLPGPDDPVPPAGGDWYIVADPTGQLSPETGASIHGNGFSINGEHRLVMTEPYAWAAFQFDSVNRAWITFSGSGARPLRARARRAREC